MNRINRIKLKWRNNTTILLLFGVIIGSILIGTLFGKFPETTVVGNLLNSVAKEINNERAEGFETTSVCISDPEKNGISDVNKSVTKVWRQT